MQSFIQHARRFPKKIASEREAYAALAQGQQPQALFICCSDSRVVPARITGARPGHLFELRTAGNIVPAYRPDAGCGVAGTVEFAVMVLNVPDIIVCGHTHCGAVQGIARPQTVHGMPLLRQWLARAAPPERVVQGPDAGHDELARRHLLTQLGHLRTYPCVAERLDDGRLRLHAWFYAIDTGRMTAYQPSALGFTPL